MMAVVPPTDLNVLLCEALGLEPDRVAGIVITCKPAQAPTIEVTMFVTDDVSAPLSHVLKRCDLVPKP
jgi:hypothetical protein